MLLRAAIIILEDATLAAAAVAPGPNEKIRKGDTERRNLAREYQGSLQIAGGRAPRGGRGRARPPQLLMYGPKKLFQYQSSS